MAAAAAFVAAAAALVSAAAALTALSAALTTSAARARPSLAALATEAACARLVAFDAAADLADAFDWISPRSVASIARLAAAVRPRSSAMAGATSGAAQAPTVGMTSAPTTSVTLIVATPSAIGRHEALSICFRREPLRKLARGRPSTEAARVEPCPRISCRALARPLVQA